MYKTTCAMVVLIMTTAFAANGKEGSRNEMKLDLEKYRLANGLDVILHVDRSDPVVAVAVLFHVGSSREVPGRTGFAHLYEHIMFQRSENVPPDEFMRRIEDAGGSMNGGTWEDGTIYYEVIPKNALEMVLWMESDRMGFLLGALNQESLRNQQQVVMNEKRQRMDNTPYGQGRVALSQALYPKDHPYSWQVIGSMEDIAAATLDDVRGFFRRWYGPNNATLVIAGDIDKEQTRAWVEHYFAEIPQGPEADPIKPQVPVLEQDKRIGLEDKRATLAELTLVWPTVPSFAGDEAALDLLADVLAGGKKSLLYKRLVQEKQLTSRVEVSNRTLERAGFFAIKIKAFPGIELDRVLKELDQAMTEFSPEHVDETLLAQIKAQYETGFLRQIESVFGKSMQLAVYNAFAGDPDFMDQDLKRYQAVTTGQVLAAFDTYLRNRPRIIMSIVPTGASALQVSGSTPFLAPADPGLEGQPLTEGEPEVVRTPSRIDRQTPPEQGAPLAPPTPAPYHEVLAGGMELWGVTRSELPLVQFTLDIEGGHGREPLDKAGTAHIAAALLKEGTARLTPIELEEALDLLGSSISVQATDDSIQLEGTCLARNFGPTMDLVREMLLTPRFDQEEFDRLRRKSLSDLTQQQGDPGWTAWAAVRDLLYREGTVMTRPILGTRESLSSLTLDDVRAYYEGNIRPERTRIIVVGAATEDQAREFAAQLDAAWKETGPGSAPAAPAPREAEVPKITLIHFPGAPQAEVRAVRWAFPRSDPAYDQAFITNFTLGGTFNSRLNLILREEKGWTYGAQTSFECGRSHGRFVGSTAVQSNALAGTIEVFEQELARTLEGPSDQELEFTRNSLGNGAARKLETLSALRSWLLAKVINNLPLNYLTLRHELLLRFSREMARDFAKKYLDPSSVRYLVVGDADQLVPQLEAAGFKDIKVIRPTAVEPQ